MRNNMTSQQKKEENLVFLTKETAKIAGRNAGIASGIKRRKNSNIRQCAAELIELDLFSTLDSDKIGVNSIVSKKNMKECAQALLNLEVKEKNAIKTLQAYGIEDKEDMTNAMLISVAMLSRAQGGSILAYRALLEQDENKETNKTSEIDALAKSVFGELDGE